MRKSPWLMIFLGMFAAGCPMTGGGDGNPEAVLEGEWDATDAQNRELALVFNERGVLVQIRGTSDDGQDVTIDVSNSTTELDGSNLTIRVPVGNVTAEFTGTLSADENMIEGTLSRTIIVGVDLQITIGQGEISAVRDLDGDDGDLPQDLVALFEAELDGAQETPPVASAGTGTGSVGVTANDEYVIQIAASGLTGLVTAAHIHLGAVGIAGGIVLPLSDRVVETDGVVTINTTVTDADFDFAEPMTALEALRTGNLYFNLHTDANPAGEIRGQLLEADDAPG